MASKNVVEFSDQIIVTKIYFIKGQKIMFDYDLAEMYGVETKQLKRQVRRNIERFPGDFMFEISLDELEILRSQFGASSWGGSRYKPMAFTEQGVAMLSSVLKSPSAIAVNIRIVRIFSKMRELLGNNKDILLKLEKLERKILSLEDSSKEHEGEISIIFEALKQLLNPGNPPRRKIGYKS